MLQIATKIFLTILFTAIYGSVLYFVWTREIDLYRTLTKPITTFLQTKEDGSIEIDSPNITALKFRLSYNKYDGNICLLFYNSIKCVNLTDKAVTIKSVHLRYEFDGKTREEDSFYIAPGHVATSQGLSDSIILYRQIDSKITKVVIEDWKNIRTDIGEEKPVIPGAVWGGSAVFMLDEINDVDSFEKIKNFSIVIKDYSGGESINVIPTQSKWIDQARSIFLENRTFNIDRAGNIKYE